MLPNRLGAITRVKPTATVLLSLFLLTGAASLLEACNTVHGVEEDASDTAHVVTHSFDSNKTDQKTQ
jgi:predicted small secreted protein